VRNEKVKVLRAIRPITAENIAVAQYGEGKLNGVMHKSYVQDSAIPSDSVVPTSATIVLYVDNPRWAGVPFILKCGKGLNQRKAEVRVQFHTVPGALYKGAPRNELVMRV
jgi:glucose-6-phosphate 1-dehydrogenase